MSDSRDRSGDPPVNSADFQEWVEHTAETRGVDETELLNQLVSAFWILDEMNGVTGDQETLGGMDSLYPPGDGRRPDQPAAEPQTPAKTDSHDRQAADDVDTTSDGRRSTGSTGSADESDEVDAGSVADELRTLQESMNGQMELIQTVAQLRRQISDLSLDVEQQRSRQDQFTDRISDELTRIHRRLETLDERTDETDGVDEADLDQISADLTAEIDRLDSTQREFETWVDEELDEIEALFGQLIDQMETLEERVDNLDAKLTTLDEDDDEAADRLAVLRRDALDIGTDIGRCERCERTVDLSMLDDPTCPECDATFTTVEPAGGWNPFAKPRLRTGHPTPTPPRE